jgi:hypothetical protein
MILPNKVYDICKFMAQIALPALATFYFALSQIWALPLPEQVVGTIVAVNVFLGALLGLSNIQYKAMQKDFNRAFDGYNQLTYLAEEKETPNSLSPLLAMDSKTYNIVKWVVIIFMPAIGALYFALSEIWGFPYGQEIVGTIASITAFAGIMLGVSTKAYKAVSPNKLVS